VASDRLTAKVEQGGAGDILALVRDARFGATLEPRSQDQLRNVASLGEQH
jgi:hypothetical protein